MLTLVSDAQNRDVETEEVIGDVAIEVRGVGVEAVLGDVTSDGGVNVLDVVAIVNIVLGTLEPTQEQAWAADVTCDGIVNVLDAVALLNFILTGSSRVAVTPEVLSFFESLASKMSAQNHARLMEMVKGIQAPVPGRYGLAQNYPNPFNPETEIAFDLPEQVEVVLKVYNVLGQEVGVLVSGVLEAGHHAVKWDASDLPSGIYFYSIKANEFMATKRMVLMK